MGDAQLAEIAYDHLWVLEKCPNHVYVQDVKGLVADQVKLESLRAVLYHLLYDLHVSFLEL